MSYVLTCIHLMRCLHNPLSIPTGFFLSVGFHVNLYRVNRMAAFSLCRNGIPYLFLNAEAQLTPTLADCLMFISWVARDISGHEYVMDTAYQDGSRASGLTVSQ